MQSTLVKHNKFFKAGHATSFDTAKRYAVSCDKDSNEYGRINSPGLITTGDFSLVMSFRYNHTDPVSVAPFQITEGLRGQILRGGKMRILFADGTSSTYMDTNNNVIDEEWHTIVISCDRDGDMNYYEDYDTVSGYTEGVDISGVTGSIEDEGDDNWLFGYNIPYYAGIDFDQIAVFDSALGIIDAVVIYLLLQAGREITDQGGVTPICYWKCNEGTGTSVANEGSTAGDYNMQLYNTPTWITDGII